MKNLVMCIAVLLVFSAAPSLLADAPAAPAAPHAGPAAPPDAGAPPAPSPAPAAKPDAAKQPPGNIAAVMADFQKIVTEAKAKALPALVYIKPVQERLEGGEAKRQQVVGSGVIIDKQGHVITNNHVAEKAKQIRCVLYDKSEMDAKVVGLDEETDLAVIQLDLSDYKGDLPVATLGSSSELTEGDFVMALGAPLGFSRSVSLGVVSNLERYFDEAPYTCWIQTDAAINPGNSGGPLINLKGEVIGINSMKMTAGENMGFAIPVDLVKVVAKELIANKEIKRSWTGIKFQELKDFSKSETLASQEGVIVGGIFPNSPASKTNLIAGDIITEVNGTKVNCVYQNELAALQRFFAALPIGKEAVLTVQRGKDKLKISITPEERSKREGDEMECKEWGMTVKELTKLVPVLSHYRENGVFVLGLKTSGDALASGFQQADIIVKVGDKEINSMADFEAAYNDLIKLDKGKRKVLVEVDRLGYPQFIVLDFNKPPQEDEEDTGAGGDDGGE